MIYKAVEVIWIFSAGGRADIEGTIRGPRGPKNASEMHVVLLIHSFTFL